MKLVRTLQSATNVEVIAASHELFEAGLELFSTRHDKEWSLTDCISFTLMRRHGLTEAFASDHHFEQAGFRNLLKGE